MAEEESGERTEEATSQRREEFRRQGMVAQTRELSSVLMLLGSALAMWLLGRIFMEQVIRMMNESLTTYLIDSVRNGDLFSAARFAFEKAAVISLPFLGLCLVLGFSSSVLQTGFLTKEDALAPKFENLDPVAGLKKLFSLRALVEGIKALLKITLVLGIAFMIIKKEFITAPFLIHFSIEQLMTHLGDVSLRIIMGIGTFMIVLAGLDYGFQRWDLEQRMKMTKQEVKEEFKNREGDPQIKARIRKIQRDVAQRRMMDAVPKADVIITNPTHIAIALKYSANLPAPQLIAKGAGEVAERIKKKAREFNIPVVENKPLARAIFKTLKIGQVIPRELYNAVAEVLAYVYKLKRKLSRS